MITAPTNWDTLWADQDTEMELRFTLDGKNYYNADLDGSDCKVTQFLYNSYSIGNACIGKLTITLLEPGAIARGVRKATLACRLKKGSTYTSWVSQGTWYLNTVEIDKTSGAAKLGLYDGLALCDDYVYDKGIAPTSGWPKTAAQMVQIICNRTGITYPADDSAFKGISCTAPDGRTCREVLGYIAAAAGGNFTMAKDGKLRFVPLGGISGKPAYKVSVSDLTQTSEKEQVTGISLTAGNEEYSFGSDSGLYLQANCDYAAQTIVSNLYYKLSNPKYQGFKASGAYITPLCELGDYIEIEDSGEYMLLDSYSLLYEQGCWGSIESPLRDEVEERIKYQGERDRKINNLQTATNANAGELAYMTTGEYLSELLERLNKEANESGGYTYITEGQGIRTYDVAVSDPLVGSEAHSVVEVKGGTVRIADSRDKNGNWNWKTVFTSGHIAAEIVTAANLTAGFIGAPSGNYWNLDTGAINFSTNVSFGGNSVEQIISASEGAINAVGDVSLLKAGSTNSVDVEYGISSSASTKPTSWYTTANTLWNQKGKFLWTRQKMTMYDGKVKYSTPRLLSDGKQLVKEIREQYYLSTSKTALAGGSWADKQQSYVNGRYYWTRNRIEWANGTVTYEPSANGELAQAFTSVTDIYDSRLDQKKVFNILTNNGKSQGLFTDSKGNLFVNGTYISTGVLSDKAGRNWWNLNTGDISIMGLSTLEKKVDNLKVGGTNLLNGTAAWTNWFKRRVTVSGEQANFPAQSADWDSSIYSPLATIQYGKVKGKEATISFDVKCSSAWGAVADKNAVWVALELHTTATRSRHRWRAFKISKQPTTSWQRISFTTTLTNALFTGGTGTIADANMLGLEIYNRSNKALQVRRVKMEIGNIASDWCATDYDAQLDATTKANKALSDANANATTKANKALSDAKSYTANEVSKAKTATYAQAKSYVDAISKKDRQYTDQQKKDLSNSLTQAAIFNKLTNNGKIQTLQMSGGKLYINGEYIKTGTLKAGILKAGILSPARVDKGNFQINMETGYAMFRNVELTNMTAKNGIITSSAGETRLQIEGGQLRGYRGTSKTPVCYIDATARVAMKGSKTHKVLKTVNGLQIQSNGTVRISSPYLSVSSTSNVHTDTTRGFTGSVKLKNLTFNQSSKRFYTGSVELKFINGIFIGVGDWTEGLVSKTKQYGEGK